MDLKEELKSLRKRRKKLSKELEGRKEPSTVESIYATACYVDGWIDALEMIVGSGVESID